MMDRRTLPRFAGAFFMIVLSLSVVTRGASLKVISQPTAGLTDAPVLLIVVADNYLASEEQEFNYDVENFFKYGLLLDSYYKNKKNDMAIVSYFNSTPPGQQSIYDFSIGPGEGNCAVKPGPKTTENLEAILASVNSVPSNVHYIVIGKQPYNFGCTDGIWTYVALDAVGTDVLQHELGHYLGKLFDEWAVRSNGVTPYPESIPTSDNRNCWPGGPGYTGPVPHWLATFPGSGQIPGCDLYQEGVVHAFSSCRMGATNYRKFCAVCEAALEKAFQDMRTPYRAPQLGPQTLNLATSRGRILNAAFIEQPKPVPPPAAPPPPPLTSRPIMRLLVTFDPGVKGGGTVKPVNPSFVLKKKTFVTGAYVTSYTNAGEFLYEIQDGGQTREIGILPSHLFTARGYRAGSGQHRTGTRNAADVVIAIPDYTEARFNTSDIRVIVYRVPRSVNDRIINIETFQALRKSHSFEKVIEEPIPVK
jgi:hypothetical protein